MNELLSIVYYLNQTLVEGSSVESQSINVVKQIKTSQILLPTRGFPKTAKNQTPTFGAHF